LKIETVEQHLSGNGLQQFYRYERKAHYANPEAWWLQILAIRPPSTESPDSPEEDIEARFRKARQMLGTYDPAPGTPFGNMSLDQQRIVLEQRVERARILRQKADDEEVRLKTKISPGRHEVMPPESVTSKLLRACWIDAHRTAKRLAAEEKTARALLAALLVTPNPQKSPAMPPSSSNVSARTACSYSRTGKTRADSRAGSSRHHLGKHAKRTLFAGLLLVALIMAQTIESLPLWNFPLRATSEVPEGTTLFLQLDYDDILTGADVRYFFATNQCVLVTRVEGTPVVNFSIGDGTNPPEEYFATEGLKWWAINFPEEGWGNATCPYDLGYDYYNITFTSSTKQYIQAVAIQPLILGKGNCSRSKTDPAYEYKFNATSEIAVIVWSDADMGTLAIQLDDHYLKDPDTQEWGISENLFAVQELGSPLILTDQVDPGEHCLKFANCGNLSFTVVSNFDTDGDELSSADEVARAFDMSTTPFLPDPWGKHTSIIENATNVIDANYSIIGNQQIWQRRSLDLFIPGLYDGLSTAVFADVILGEFAKFEVDGETELFADETISGYYTENDEIISMMDKDGNVHTGPACEFFSMKSLFLGILAPGRWHEINYLARINPLQTPEIQFRVNGQEVIIWESESIPAPELDSDGDTVPDSVPDFSPSTFLRWTPNTIHQTVLPVGDLDAQVQFQVVRPPHDQSTNGSVEWHAGERGSLKCHVTPALRLFGVGDVSAPDYWYKEESCAPIWGENGIDPGNCHGEPRGPQQHGRAVYPFSDTYGNAPGQGIFAELFRVRIPRGIGKALAV